PISQYSDFDRYSKEKFSLGEQYALSLIYKELVDGGVFAMLSNSSSEISTKLYSEFKIETVRASRHINSSGRGRGKIDEILVLPQRIISTNFPSTRYMGSKSTLIPHLTDIVKTEDPGTALDAFSGSGVVSYHLKSLGYTVISNDFLKYSSTVSKALIENSSITLSGQDLDTLLRFNRKSSNFVQKTFSGLYFKDEDNLFID